MTGSTVLFEGESPAGHVATRTVASVLICDRRSVTRIALANALRRHHSISEISCVTDGFELVGAFSARPADLVLIGCEVGGTAGARAIQLLLSLHPTATVLAFGSRGAGGVLAEAVTIGARGLMLWDVPGSGSVDASSAPPLFSRTSGRRGDTISPLTERELQILTGMSRGRSNAEIGRALFLSEDTIKTHARRVFNKLGAFDRAHAVLLGMRCNLVI